MTDFTEVQRLMHYMPIIVRDADVTDWERKFCASIIHRSRRESFKPSEKQVSVMQRLVSKFQERSMRDGEVVE